MPDRTRAALRKRGRDAIFAAMKRLSHAFWFTCAAIFIIEAWLWDKLGGLLKALVALLPFAALKRAIVSALDKAPAPVVLLVFVIPVAAIEPFKLAALWAITHHHIIIGALLFVGAKFAGLGITAFLFEATRDKLLTMNWFARFYHWVLRIRTLAHDFLEPYKQRIRAAMAPFKQKLHDYFANAAERGGFGHRLLLLRNRVQKFRRVPEG